MVHVCVVTEVTVCQMFEILLSYDHLVQREEQSRTLDAREMSDRKGNIEPRRETTCEDNAKGNMKLEDCKSSRPEEDRSLKHDGETLNGYLWTMEENISGQMPEKVLRWACLEKMKTSGDASQAPKLRICGLTETPWRTRQWRCDQLAWGWQGDPPGQCSQPEGNRQERTKLAAEQLDWSIPSMVRHSQSSIRSTAERQSGYQQHRRLRKCQMHTRDCRCRRKMESNCKEKQDSIGLERRHSNQYQDSRSKDCHRRGRCKVSHIQKERHEPWE
jgi:hypothetical protein